MQANNALRWAAIARTTSRAGLLLIGLVVFGISLIMGADLAKEGLDGLASNAPNALPWLALLVLIGIAWKWELIGGVLITLAGAWMVYLFNSGPNFWISTFLLSLAIPLLGVGLIASWWLRRGTVQSR